MSLTLLLADGSLRSRDALRDNQAARCEWQPGRFPVILLVLFAGKRMPGWNESYTRMEECSICTYLGSYLPSLIVSPVGWNQCFYQVLQASLFAC